MKQKIIILSVFLTCFVSIAFASKPRAKDFVASAGTRGEAVRAAKQLCSDFLESFYEDELLCRTQDKDVYGSTSGEFPRKLATERHYWKWGCHNLASKKLGKSLFESKSIVKCEYSGSEYL